MDPIKVGTHHIRSMLCSLTNVQEVAAPRAALYILHDSAVYSSHKFVKLFLASIEKTLFDRGQLDVILTDSHLGLQTSSQYLDYVYHPDSLEDVGLLEYNQRWEKRRSKNCQQLHDRHQQPATHTLFRRKNKVIVTVIHTRLPNTGDPDTSESQKRQYYRQMLTLFKPFRSSTRH
jgi:hypothetical protein